MSQLVHLPLYLGSLVPATSAYMVMHILPLDEGIVRCDVNAFPASCFAPKILAIALLANSCSMALIDVYNVEEMIGIPLFDSEPVNADST